MSKKNEDGVESFFRKAANQSDTSFIAEDWQKMEKMLNERFAGKFAVKRQRIKRAVISGVAISAFLLSMYFISFQSDEPLVGGESSAEQKQAAVVPKQDVHPENPAAALLLNPEIIDDGEGAKAIKEEYSNNRDQRGTRVVADAASQYQHGRGINERRTNDEADQLDIQDESADFPLAPLPMNPPAGDDAIIQSGFTKSVAGQEIVKEDNHTEGSTSAPALEQSSTDELQQPTQHEKEISAASRWRVNVLFAPDFSTTALSRYSAPGTSIGLLIGFQLGKKFIVHTGASYSFKRYEGYGNEYQPPPDYWERRTNGIIPDEIQGRCQVLEIPLILHYNIRQSNRSRVFIGAGLGSYIMLDEKYDYAFHTPNPGAADGWSSASSTSYPWAIGNLSLGYDRQVSPALSIGIEPFLKVPFGKIGWSNITLYTTGVNINIQYRFLKRRLP